MNTIQTIMTGEGLKIGIVAGRFNDFITNQLVNGAEGALVSHQVNSDDIDLVYVPGAFEIPLVAKKMAESGKYDAVIALGCVIRGVRLIMIMSVINLQKVYWKPGFLRMCR